MHEVVTFLHEFLYFLIDGLRAGFSHINAALGLLIAAVFAYSLGELKRICVAAIGATLVHLVALVLPAGGQLGRALLEPGQLLAQRGEAVLARLILLLAE